MCIDINTNICFAQASTHAHAGEELRPGTYRYYISNWTSPIYEGSDLSVGVFTYALMTIKHEQMMSDTAFETMLKFFVHALPSNNKVPSSLYMLSKLCNMTDIAECEYHLCPLEHYRYPKISPASWESHADDKCPVCAALGETTPRFSCDAGGRLRPTKVS